jgi:transcriptional regulator with XRE-family HTH domain
MPNRASRSESPHRDAAATLAKRLRDARTKQGVSQQEVARRAAVSIGTVRSLEGGRSVDPSYFTVLAIAQALEISMSDLSGLG